MWAAGRVPAAGTCRAGAGGRHRHWGGPSVLPPSQSLPGGPAALPKSTWAHGRAKGAPGGQPAAHGPPPSKHVSTSHLSAPWRPRFWKLPDTFSPWGSALAGTEGPWRAGWVDDGPLSWLGVFCSRPGPGLRCPVWPANAGLSLARAHGSDFRVHHHALLLCPTCEGSGSVSALRAP